MSTSSSSSGSNQRSLRSLLFQKPRGAGNRTAANGSNSEIDHSGSNAACTVCHSNTPSLGTGSTVPGSMINSLGLPASMISTFISMALPPSLLSSPAAFPNTNASSALPSGKDTALGLPAASAATASSGDRDVCSSSARCSCKAKCGLKEKIKSKFELRTFFSAEKTQQQANATRMLSELLSEGKIAPEVCLDAGLLDRLVELMQSRSLQLDALVLLLVLIRKLRQKDEMNATQHTAIISSNGQSLLPPAAAAPTAAPALPPAASEKKKKKKKKKKSAAAVSNELAVSTASAGRTFGFDDIVSHAAFPALLESVLQSLKFHDTRNTTCAILSYLVSRPSSTRQVIDSPTAIGVLLETFNALTFSTKPGDELLLLELTAIIARLCRLARPNQLSRLDVFSSMLMAHVRSKQPLLVATACTALERLCELENVAESVLKAKLAPILLAHYHAAVERMKKNPPMIGNAQTQAAAAAHSHISSADSVLVDDVFGLVGMLLFKERAAPSSFFCSHIGQHNKRAPSKSNQFAPIPHLTASHQRCGRRHNILEIISSLMDCVLERRVDLVLDGWHYMKMSLWQLTMLFSPHHVQKNSRLAAHRVGLLIDSGIFKRIFLLVSRTAQTQTAATALRALPAAASQSGSVSTSATEMPSDVWSELIRLLLSALRHATSSQICFLVMAGVVQVLLFAIKHSSANVLPTEALQCSCPSQRILRRALAALLIIVNNTAKRKAHLPATAPNAALQQNAPSANADSASATATAHATMAAQSSLPTIAGSDSGADTAASSAAGTGTSASHSYHSVDDDDFDSGVVAASCDHEPNPENAGIDPWFEEDEDDDFESDSELIEDDAADDSENEQLDDFEQLVAAGRDDHDSRKRKMRKKVSAATSTDRSAESENADDWKEIAIAANSTGTAQTPLHPTTAAMEAAAEPPKEQTITGAEPPKAVRRRGRVHILSTSARAQHLAHAIHTSAAPPQHSTADYTLKYSQSFTERPRSESEAKVVYLPAPRAADASNAQSLAAETASASFVTPVETAATATAAVDDNSPSIDVVHPPEPDSDPRSTVDRAASAESKQAAASGAPATAATRSGGLGLRLLSHVTNSFIPAFRLLGVSDALAYVHDRCDKLKTTLDALAAATPPSTPPPCPPDSQLFMTLTKLQEALRDAEADDAKEHPPLIVTPENAAAAISSWPQSKAPEVTSVQLSFSTDEKTASAALDGVLFRRRQPTEAEALQQRRAHRAHLKRLHQRIRTLLRMIFTRIQLAAYYQSKPKRDPNSATTAAATVAAAAPSAAPTAATSQNPAPAPKTAKNGKNNAQLASTVANALNAIQAKTANHPTAAAAQTNTPSGAGKSDEAAAVSVSVRDQKKLDKQRRAAERDRERRSHDLERQRAREKSESEGAAVIEQMRIARIEERLSREGKLPPGMSYADYMALQKQQEEQAKIDAQLEKERKEREKIERERERERQREREKQLEREREQDRIRQKEREKAAAAAAAAAEAERIERETKQNEAAALEKLAREKAEADAKAEADRRRDENLAQQARFKEAAAAAAAASAAAAKEAAERIEKEKQSSAIEEKQADSRTQTPTDEDADRPTKRKQKKSSATQPAALPATPPQNTVSNALSGPRCGDSDCGFGIDKDDECLEVCCSAGCTIVYHHFSGGDDHRCCWTNALTFLSISDVAAESESAESAKASERGNYHLFGDLSSSTRKLARNASCPNPDCSGRVQSVGILSGGSTVQSVLSFRESAKRAESAQERAKDNQQREKDRIAEKDKERTNQREKEREKRTQKKQRERESKEKSHLNRTNENAAASETGPANTKEKKKPFSITVVVPPTKESHDRALASIPHAAPATKSPHTFPERQQESKEWKDNSDAKTKRPMPMAFNSPQPQARFYGIVPPVAAHHTVTPIGYAPFFSNGSAYVTVPHPHNPYLITHAHHALVPPRGFAVPVVPSRKILVKDGVISGLIACSPHSHMRTRSLLIVSIIADAHVLAQHFASYGDIVITNLSNAHFLSVLVEYTTIEEARNAYSALSHPSFQYQIRFADEPTTVLNENAAWTPLQLQRQPMHENAPLNANSNANANPASRSPSSQSPLADRSQNSSPSPSLSTATTASHSMNGNGVTASAESEAWPTTPALQAESPTPGAVDLMAPFSSALFPSVKLSSVPSASHSHSALSWRTATAAPPIVTSIAVSHSADGSSVNVAASALFSADRDRDGDLSRLTPDDSLGGDADADSDSLSPSLNATLPPFLSFMTSDDRVLSPTKGTQASFRQAGQSRLPTLQEPLGDEAALSHSNESGAGVIHLNERDSSVESSSAVSGSLLNSLGGGDGELEWDDELEADIGAYDERSGDSDILI